MCNLETRATALEPQFAPALAERRRQFAALVELDERSISESNVPSSTDHRIVDTPFDAGVGIHLCHQGSPTCRAAQLAVREPTAGAERKKKAGCDGRPFPIMTCRPIVVGFSFDFFPLTGEEAPQCKDFARALIGIAVRCTQREPVFKLGPIALGIGAAHARKP